MQLHIRGRHSVYVVFLMVIHITISTDALLFSRALQILVECLVVGNRLGNQLQGYPSPCNFLILYPFCLPLGTILTSTGRFEA